jgi:hypothetical protein
LFPFDVEFDNEEKEIYSEKELEVINWILYIHSTLSHHLCYLDLWFTYTVLL